MTNALFFLHALFGHACSRFVSCFFQFSLLHIITAWSCAHLLLSHL
jgi:hypothetical protein